MSNEFVTPSSKDWLLVEDAFDKDAAAKFETLFTLANGYAGLRGSAEVTPDLGDAGYFVAGVFGNTGGFGHEIVNLPTWAGVSGNMDGFDYDLHKGAVLAYRRTLDMRQGLLFTSIDYRDGAKHTTRWESARLVHKTRKHLALLWGRVTPLDFSGRLTVSQAIDAHSVKYASSSHRSHWGELRPLDLGEAGIAMDLTLAKTGIRVVELSQLRVAGAQKRSVTLDDDRVRESFVCDMKQGQPVTWEKRFACVTSRDAADPLAAAREELASTGKKTIVALCKEHTKAWEKVWDVSDVVIEGDARAQQAIRFNTFHLASLAAPEDEHVSIGAKGLHGTGYRGCVFWDTETYMVPFFTFTDPASARALLMYRYHLLPDAIENARASGLAGARIPWNATLTAREGMGFGWQDHQTGDLAYAVDQYITATGDREFYLGRQGPAGAFAAPGAEMIIETARFWATRGEYDESGRYNIRRICGPDEIHGGINNNTYTNYLAAWNLRRAVTAMSDARSAGVADQLAAKLHVTDEEVARWAKIADDMVLPYSEQRGFHEQFEGFFQLAEPVIDPHRTQNEYTGPVLHSYRPTQGAKQADTVLMYYLWPHAFDDKTRRTAYKYYEPRCTHCSSLSRGAHAVLAAQIGLTGEAYRLWLRGAELDYGEFAECDSGIHAASLGGAWQGVIMGFAGFTIRDGLPSFTPHLPAKWKSLRFTVRWGKTLLDVSATPKQVTVRPRKGSVQAYVDGEMKKLSAK